MMEDLQIFENEQFGTVRTVEENGVILFCAVDVANALGYKDTVNAIKAHCREDGVAFHHLIDNMGRMQTAKFIDEGNLYRLIVHSKLPTAEQFERWVFDEVLPTIRRSGAYLEAHTESTVLMPEPHDYIQAARIVASCPRNRLTVVVSLLKSAGIEMPELDETLQPLNTLKPIDRQRKPVAQYTKDGALVQVYNSVRDAGRESNIGASAISRCCAGERRSAGGYDWKYYNGGVLK